MTAPNARFWLWYRDGWVKLTLRPGQQLSTCYGGPCDEGYSYTREWFEHDGERVISAIANESSDCDGRLDTYRRFSCPLADLRARAAYGADLLVPEWQRECATQRDYAAEAMGY